MWFPHRMCRRRSHALTLFSQQRKPSPRRKRLFLVTRAISPRHQQPAAPGGGASGGGGARAREFLDSQGQGAPKPALGAFWFYVQVLFFRHLHATCTCTCTCTAAAALAQLALALGTWLLALGSWLLAAGCWLLAASASCKGDARRKTARRTTSFWTRTSGCFVGVIFSQIIHRRSLVANGFG